MAEKIRVGAGDWPGGKEKGILIQIEGTTPEELEASVERLGKLPQSAIAAGVRKVAGYERNLARRYAPKGKTGNLRKYLRAKREKSRTKGKVVYDVRMEGGSEANALFQKRSKDGTYAYYPASQEYGFATRKPGNRVPGRYFMRRSAIEIEKHAEQIMTDAMAKAVDKAWERQQAKGE